MVEIYLIIFTSMEPNVPPMLQEVPMFNLESCEAAIDSLTENFGDIEGYAYTMRCDRRVIEKEEDVE